MEIRISSSIFLNNVILFANLYLRGIQRSNTSSYSSWWDPSLSGWDIPRRHWGIIVTVSTWIRLILLVRNRAWVSLLGFIFSLFHKKRLKKYTMENFSQISDLEFFLLRWKFVKNFDTSYSDFSLQSLIIRKTQLCVMKMLTSRSSFYII